MVRCGALIFDYVSGETLAPFSIYTMTAATAAPTQGFQASWASPHCQDWHELCCPDIIYLDRLTMMDDGATGGASTTASQLPTMAARIARFILDSGASAHATGKEILFTLLTALPPGRAVRTANAQALPVVACGTVVTDNICLPDVLYVPELACDIVSVSKLGELDYSVLFAGGECLVMDLRTRQIAGHGRLVGGLYHLDWLEIPLDRVVPAQVLPA